MRVTRVEDALFSRAVGCTVRERQTCDGPNGRATKKTVRELAPDVLAQIFYLKNRSPEHWNDRQSLDVRASIVGLGEEITARMKDAARRRAVELGEGAVKQVGDKK